MTFGATTRARAIWQATSSGKAVTGPETFPPTKGSESWKTKPKTYPKSRDTTVRGLIDQTVTFNPIQFNPIDNGKFPEMRLSG